MSENQVKQQTKTILPREVVDASPLEVFKTSLDKALGGIPPIVGEWNQMVFKVPSNPSDSLILRIHYLKKPEHDACVMQGSWVTHFNLYIHFSLAGQAGEEGNNIAGDPPQVNQVR